MGTHPIFESDFDCLTDISMTVVEQFSDDYFVQKVILKQVKITILFSATCFYARPYLSKVINSKQRGICLFLYRAARFSERSSLIMGLAFFTSAILTLNINLGLFYSCIYLLYAVVLLTLLVIIKNDLSKITFPRFY